VNSVAVVATLVLSMGSALADSPKRGEPIERPGIAGVTAPRDLVKAPPIYPEAARLRRISGVVLLEAVITKSGLVESLRVLRSVDPLLDQAAIDAVRHWEYTPARKDGRPVPVYLTVTVNFTLTNDPKPPSVLGTWHSAPQRAWLVVLPSELAFQCRLPEGTQPLRSTGVFHDRAIEWRSHWATAGISGSGSTVTLTQGEQVLILESTVESLPKECRSPF
jgi:TonB family protein